MHVGIERIPRRPPWPGWAVALVGLWLAAVQLLAWLAPGAPTCLFRRTTGAPCPTCGLTRGVGRIQQGDIWGGFAFNPLIMAGLAALGALLLARLTLGRGLRIESTARERMWLWGAGAVAFCANWAYVLAGATR